jgi:proteasome lid subunit RPN8/RPN11
MKCFEDIKEYILSKYPEEACGIIVEGVFIPLENVHEEPEKHFTIKAEDLIPYAGKISYIIHSHCRNPKKPEVIDLRTPSFSDISGQKDSGVPWLIFGTEGYTVKEPLELPRVHNNDYIFRPFIWYINDCYSLVQDYYEFEFGIILPDHKADKDFADIRRINNIFGPFISEYGFIEFSPINHEFQKGDLVLLDQHGYEQNHLGIFEDGFILHQDMMSKKERIEHFIGRIHKVLRHESKSI